MVSLVIPGQSDFYLWFERERNCYETSKRRAKRLERAFNDIVPIIQMFLDKRRVPAPRNRNSVNVFSLREGHFGLPFLEGSPAFDEKRYAETKGITPTTLLMRSNNPPSVNFDSQIDRVLNKNGIFDRNSESYYNYHNYKAFLTMLTYRVDETNGGTEDLVLNGGGQTSLPLEYLFSLYGRIHI